MHGWLWYYNFGANIRYRNLNIGNIFIWLPSEQNYQRYGCIIQKNSKTRSIPIFLASISYSITKGSFVGRINPSLSITASVLFGRLRFPVNWITYIISMSSSAAERPKTGLYTCATRVLSGKIFWNCAIVADLSSTNLPESFAVNPSNFVFQIGRWIIFL